MRDRARRWVKGSVCVAVGWVMILALCASCGPRREEEWTFSPVPIPTETPARDGDRALVLPITLSEGMLDPIADTSLWNQGFFQLIYDTPIGLDESGKPTAGVLVRWESVRGNEWVFSVREGVAFHDGTPLGAEDIVRSYQAYLSQEAAASYRAMLEPISSMEALPDGTLRVRAKNPGYGVLYAMRFPILGRGEVGGLPVGSGAWYIEDFTPGRECVLASNPSWYRRAVRVGTVRGIPIESEEQALGALALGELTAAPLFKQISATVVEGAGARMMQISTRQFEFLAPNFGTSLLARREVREAIAHSIDVQAIIAQRLEGQAIEAESPILPGTWLHDATTPAYHYQAERAHSVLQEGGWTMGEDGIYALRTVDEAGFPRSERLSIRLITNEDPISPARRESARYIADMLGKAGIEAEVIALGWDEYQAALTAQDFDLALVGLNVDRTADIRPLLSSGGARNIMGFENAGIDALLTEAAEAADEATMISAYARLQHAVAAELPIIGLYFRNGLLAYHPELTGLTASSQDALYQRADTWAFQGF